MIQYDELQDENDKEKEMLPKSAFFWIGTKSI